MLGYCFDELISQLWTLVNWAIAGAWNSELACTRLFIFSLHSRQAQIWLTLMELLKLGKPTHVSCTGFSGRISSIVTTASVKALEFDEPVVLAAKLSLSFSSSPRCKLWVGCCFRIGLSKYAFSLYTLIINKMKRIMVWILTMVEELWAGASFCSWMLLYQMFLLLHK